MHKFKRLLLLSRVTDLGYLSRCLQGLSHEHKMFALAQVVVVHALGDLGDCVIPREALQQSMHKLDLDLDR